MPVPTPFHERTAPLCESLRFKEWAGYTAVCSYDTHLEPEYFAFRNAAGLLDISPLYKYEITGPDSAPFLSFVATRDVANLRIGRVTYACLCDEQGKIIDDGTIARLAEQRFRITTASPAFRWLDRHRRGFSVEIADVSESTAALALQGPASRAIIEQLDGAEIGELRFFGVTPARIAGVEVEISRTGYTGDLGYEIWIPADSALPVWDAILEAGGSRGVLPAGLDALDITRVEAGFVLQDVDYFSAPRCAIESRKSSPFEVDLGWTVALDREPFVGQAALRAEHKRGSPWALVGLDIDWPGIEALYESHGLPPKLPSGTCRTAVPMFDEQVQVGQVTSSTWSPILKKYIALATVRSAHADTGRSLLVEHTVEYERRKVTATIVERPFFDPDRKRA